MKTPSADDKRLKANRDKRQLTAKEERQREFARKRWRLQGMIGTTWFAEKGLSDLLRIEMDQDFYIVQVAMQSIRAKLRKKLAKLKLQQQVQISKEKADEDASDH